MSWVTPEKFAAQVILNVCELPDYTSPDSRPDLLQCTITELEACIIRAFEHFDLDTNSESISSKSASADTEVPYIPTSGSGNNP